ncbi:MAG: DsbA family protein [Anaerolineales bacterium]|nr:MAG: DsbA family protein [Anaerolineales bacterium]
MTEDILSPTEDVEKEILEFDKGILRFRRSSVYAALLPLAFVTGLAAGYIFWGRGSETVTAVAQAVAPAPAQALVDQPDQPAPPDLRALQGQVRLEVDEDDDPVLGPDDAPITIIEFSDFRCPYCRLFHQETYTPLLEAYPDQIRFIYRDFPVVGGYEAAQASECADEQDAYWDYHDLLFSGEFEDLSQEAYLAYAERLALDLDSFSSCLEEERYKAEVDNDARYAAGLGVTGTPTFFINGIPLIGAQPLEVFQQIIDTELEG